MSLSFFKRAHTRNHEQTHGSSTTSLRATHTHGIQVKSSQSKFYSSHLFVVKIGQETSMARVKCYSSHLFVVKIGQETSMARVKCYSSHLFVVKIGQETSMARRALRAHAHCVRCLALLPLAIFLQQTNGKSSRGKIARVTTAHHCPWNTSLQRLLPAGSCSALSLCLLALSALAAAAIERRQTAKKQRCFHAGEGISQSVTWKVARSLSTQAVDCMVFIGLRLPRSRTKTFSMFFDWKERQKARTALYPSVPL